MKKMARLIRKIKKYVINKNNWNRKYAVYKSQFNDFKKLAGENVKMTENPYLYDNTVNTGIEPHYTYHPAWAARVLAIIKPEKHIDISSITSFGTLVSAFIPVEFYDYRPANIHLSNYTSGHADLTSLNFKSNSIYSLSCMHTVEHIGLGRYGDPIDIDGDKKAMKELERVLAFGGNLLFVVPIGDSRIEFNAHRVYSYHEIIENFQGLILKEFSLIPDDFEQIGYVTNPTEEFIDKQHWGCGCFWFTKNKTE